MPVSKIFRKGEEFRTTDPIVMVQGPLTPGIYVYQLIVEDDLHNASAPVTHTVKVG
jgi:hypothetical protein